jgi:5-methylthioadenosine/S-adenosylhomocysteine deaminase
MLFQRISILNENLDIQENMFVGVKGDRIEYIGTEMPSNAADYGEGYDGKGKLLMSGFYNAHAHSPMALMRGYGENLSLDDWLNTRIFPFEDKLDGNSVYWGTMLCMAESLRSGIVSSSDMYYFLPDMAKAVDASGAKINVSRAIVSFDDTPFQQDERIQDMLHAFRFIRSMGNDRIKMDASLHAEYTNTERRARDMAAWAMENSLIMHVHVSETRKEHEECKQRHGGRTPVRFLSDCGVFDVPAIAAHCVWIEGEDFDILKEKGVTVVTNPCSNMKLASGMADTAAILKKGIRLAVGTDSVASNNSLNYPEEMKIMALTGKAVAGDPTVITPKEVLYAATRAGALAQGREDCGLLKKGFKADLIVQDISGINMHPVHDLVTNLVYSADISNVVMTMVDGRVLYKDGDYLTIDKERVVAETQKATAGILAKL